MDKRANPSTKTGGLLYITVHGASRLYTLNEDERRQFHAGELIVKQESKSGLNDCCAYHPEQYIRNKWGKELSIIDFVRVGQIDMDQDVYLFKPHGLSNTTAALLRSKMGHVEIERKSHDLTNANSRKRREQSGRG